MLKVIKLNDVSGMNTLGKGEKQRGAQTEVVSLVL